LVRFEVPYSSGRLAVPKKTLAGSPWLSRLVNENRFEPDSFRKLSTGPFIGVMGTIDVADPTDCGGGHRYVVDRLITRLNENRVCRRVC
jgi:hypothetical protein